MEGAEEGGGVEGVQVLQVEADIVSAGELGGGLGPVPGLSE